MAFAVQLRLNLEQREPERPVIARSATSPFPEEAANRLAQLESYNKNLYRPNTYFHKWWARRSGATFRFILKQLVRDPQRVDYYSPGGLEGVTILDPMMGGGTTLHEAIRLGANVAGIDIDPIPVLQARATLSLLPLADKTAIFRAFFKSLADRMARLYDTTCPICGGRAETQFTLYGLRRRCSCGVSVFVDSLVLRHDSGESVLICPDCYEVHLGTSHTCGEKRARALAEKGTTHCSRCHSPYTDMAEESFEQRYVPLVIMGHCPRHGQFYKNLGDDDLGRLEQAWALVQAAQLPDAQTFHVRGGPKSDDLLHRRIRNYIELFTPRQLLYLASALELLPQVPHEHRLWLALLVSTSLEFNCLLCGYKGTELRRAGAVRHVFSHHAYSFPYTALENNPLFSGKTSGTLNRLFHDRVVRAGEWAMSPTETRIATGRKVRIDEVDGGEPVSDWAALAQGRRRFLVLQADSATLDVRESSVDYVVTDPPYLDSVQYSDLSEFFRVWLRHLIPDEANWSYDSSLSAVSEGDGAGGSRYGKALEGIWRTCYRALKKDHGRLIFTFHHWRHQAWAELTLSLKNAGFRLADRHVVFSENPISVHIRDLQALTHDLILFLEPGCTEGSPQPWVKPDQVRTESYGFCYDCGTMLGWCLASGLDEQHIRSAWKTLIEGNRNGKASG